MRYKLHPIVVLLFVVLVSVVIVILPTFLTEGVSRVTLEKKIELPLVADSQKDIIVAFFGYSGCIDICTPRLQALARYYKSLDPKLRQRVGVEFLDISQPGDKTLPSRFARHFHNEFKGIYLSQEILHNYTRAFDIYYAQSLSDKMEFDHTSNIYIVKRDGDVKVIRYIYSAYPYDFEKITSDIKGLINE